MNRPRRSCRGVGTDHNLHTIMIDGQGVSFYKMQGTGNDFIVFDNRTYQFSNDELSACAGAWCPRRFGVGADGLLALDHPETSEADYRMQYVNADGSRATMCGNGARCLFRFAHQVGFEKASLAFDTDAGLYRATYPDDSPEQVRLFVPDVTDLRSAVSVEGNVPEAIRALFYAHAGTEHLVAMVDDVDAVPVRDWGRRLRHDPSVQPIGANVNFVERSADGELTLRTYEKGVEDETLSCGTGVVAAAVVADRTLRTQTPSVLRVHTKGGRLRVGRARTEERSQLYLEGPAVSVFSGTVSPPDLEGRKSGPVESHPST